MRSTQILLVSFCASYLMYCHSATDPSDDFDRRQILDLTAYENHYMLVYVWNEEIYKIDSKGENIQQLTNDDYFDAQPDWTPDGDAIIYQTYRNGPGSIFRMNPDGTVETDIGQGVGSCHSFDIAPTGQYIIFMENCPEGDPVNFDPDGCPAVMRINPDGSDKQVLANTPGFNAPKWSPDGQNIVVDLAGALIFKFDLNGENLTQLTADSIRNYMPEWVLDGEKIIYVSWENDREICIMDADGSNNANLTNSPASDDYLPIASPDGGKICFLSDRDGGWDIFIMNSDGSGQRNLTNGPHNPAYYPTWSPDGTRISYSTDTDGDEISDTIFVIDVETGYFQKLTSGRSPHWNPVPILQDDTYHHDDGV